MTKRINSPDTASDIQLRACLDQVPRRSFVMIAGAGSGKTTSLVKALSHILSTHGDTLKKRGQKAACITYTDIAAQEILHDVENSPLTHVSTIHNFFWTIIRPFQSDIKQWVSEKIDRKIQKLTDEAANFGSRVHQKTKDKNASEIERHEKLKEVIPGIRQFNYEIGSDYSKGILGHTDIIDLVTSLIEQKPLLNAIISQKFPYIFVDESQDTFPNIVQAMKKIDSIKNGNFCLGFFGDPMQKIYTQGAGEISPEDGWDLITKEENFRCSQAVLKLINNIRHYGDGLKQTRGRVEIIDGKEQLVEGSAQIFILPADAQRTENLKKVQLWCSVKYTDEQWKNDDEVKIFVIVHRMAANRLGFPNLYSAMNDNDSPFSDRFLDGTAWPLKLFLSFVLPLVENIRSDNNFGTISILRENSPLLLKDKVKGAELAKTLAYLKKAVDEIKDLMSEDSVATVLDVVKSIKKNHLIALDGRLEPYIQEGSEIELESDEALSSKNVLRAFLACPAAEFWGYQKYFRDQSPFTTQQGVKGAQFDRVMTILDDEEGSGHTHFSYDKYFGVTELSTTDQKNIAEGRDNVLARTRRLFYVSCSRAKKDLSVVYYTANVDTAVEAVKKLNLFEEENIFTTLDLASEDRKI